MTKLPSGDEPATPYEDDEGKRLVQVETGPAAEGRRGLALSNTRVTPLGLIAIALVLLLVLSELLVSGSLGSLATLSTLTPLVAILAIAAIGQAFVISTGGIDLSVPFTITLVGAIMVKASNGANGGLAEALVLAAVACIAIGLVNGLLIEGLGLNALVVTLATGQLIAGFTRLYRGEVLEITNVPPRLSDWSAANVSGVSYLLLIAVGVALLATAFLHRGVQGRRLVASSASQSAAFFSGIRARTYRLLAYVLAALTYGLAGVLVAGDVGTPDYTLGDPYLLTTIVAVVLGGAVLTGGRVSPVATLLGAIFVQVLDYDLQVEGLSSGLRMIVQGVVLALALSLAFVFQRAEGLSRLLGRARPPSGPAVAQGTPR